jgi:hypothetical protein
MRPLVVHARARLKEQISMQSDRSTPDSLRRVLREARDWSLLHHRLLLAGMTEGAIHAINNMLMVLDASLEQLSQDGKGQTEEFARLVRDMTAAVEQIGHVSEQMQRLARPVVIGAENPARLDQALQSALAMLRVALPRSIRLEPMPDAEALAEAENTLSSVGIQALARLMTGLGLTTKAAMPRGGQARLDARLGLGDASDADWPQRVELTWEATGTHLHEASLEMATIDEAPSMAIRAGAEDLAAAAGARLEWIECRPGSVKARLTVPCRPAQPSGPSPSHAHATVLLAAFDDYARGLTAAALRGMGHATICIGRVDQALEAWASVRAAGPCVMIVETNILGSATMEQLDRLRDLGQTETVILVRGGTREALAEPLKSCPCLLDKPYSMAQLSALVSRALHVQERKGNKS